MVIKLSEADFSAKNIGQIDITVVSQFTQDAILASGNTAMTEQQKSALENFFVAVGAKTNTGVWAKLTKVYIPFLCADLAHAMVNYKGNAIDVTLDATTFGMRNKGVAGISASPSSEHSPKISSFLHNIKQASFFAMTKEATFGTSVITYLFGQNSNSRWAISLSYSGAGALQMKVGFLTPRDAGGSLDMKLTNTQDASNKLLGFTFVPNSPTNMRVIKSDGTFKSLTNAENNNIVEDTNSSNLMLFSSYTNVPNASKTGSIAMLILGTALTDAEMTTLKTESEKLALKF